MPDSADIRYLCERLHHAEYVLIGAGAGLSADAGIDYTDEEAFAREFPGLAARGFRMKAELMGYTGWSPREQWGYLARHVNEVRFQSPPAPVYRRLLDLVSAKDYFVVTSNVDGMFYVNGFVEDRVFTPQGDYAIMQCQEPCSTVTWSSKPTFDLILPTIDPATREVADPNVIPSCPRCGGPVFMNVRGGDWFIEDPYLTQAERFAAWVERARKSSLLVLEFGSGFNTPSVVRWPMERIVYHHANAHFARVNLQWPQVPREIADRSTPFPCTAMEVISALWKASRAPESGGTEAVSQP